MVATDFVDSRWTCFLAHGGGCKDIWTLSIDFYMFPMLFHYISFILFTLLYYLHCYIIYIVSYIIYKVMYIYHIQDLCGGEMVWRLIWRTESLDRDLILVCRFSFVSSRGCIPVAAQTRSCLQGRMHVRNPLLLPNG
jgi:hypothetical protein